MTFELSYNAPDGSVGNWQKEGFDTLEDDGGGGGGPMADDEKNLINVEKGSDTDSLPSSPNKSMLGSRLSISSKTSGSKSQGKG